MRGNLHARFLGESWLVTVTAYPIRFVYRPQIESAHRYVIQKRLKLPGAWWITDNVVSMLRLRVVRANDDWQEYWSSSVAA